MSNKNAKAFSARLEKRERIWATCMTVSAASIIAATCYAAYSYGVFSSQDMSFGSFANKAIATLLFGILIAVVALKPAGYLAERTWLKSYFIEDCGDVLKLHGAVRLVGMSAAYSELLSVRPGYKIAENAWEKFECTLAAVPATQADRNAKSELESMGFQINSIA
ncbi:hypothetical protein [Marinobacter sp. F3R08]|uniref:hypothetical protein n=1 Tax=Marinobacter sp. F3R08 TaxID=2841559 RepID=UPI001C08B2F9|nr:hypothetical protein [Marinobacter sp. F3R08]MBU2952251.1 hypothetical protein [Marinobacter sp. F3R08]